MKLVDIQEARHHGSKTMTLTGELTVDDRHQDQFYSKQDVTLVVEMFREDAPVGTDNVKIVGASVADGDTYLVEILGLVGSKASYLPPHDNRGWFLMGRYDDMLWALE